MGVYDPTSYSDPRVVKTKHISICWQVDFMRKVLTGHVDLTFIAQQDNISNFILDSKDLKIEKVLLDGIELRFELGEKHSAFGRPLNINLPSAVNSGNEFMIKIKYETSSNASALQWLDAQQTAGKKHPYMFSQCQAIHARSILPCQDSPSAKAPYTAKVSVTEPLVALMSAVRCGDESFTNKQGTKMKTYKFEQKVPMPSYLIAIVVGLLESKEIGPRSRVWSEAEFVEKSAFEFSETEKMLSTAEELGGPYVWGQYDLLVLPPSFPYGGMENPCLTFVTPTLLAGDKSLANVVAHEIAHSWTGNLVTNHTWEDFWLNEGHTVFLERKIMSRMYGEKTRHFQALNGLKDLHNAVEMFGKENPFTNLVIKLDGVDPDDSFSSVPYEKGHTLLFYLESILGGPSEFEPFLLSYINKFKYGSVTTTQWKDHLYSHFSNKKSILDGVDWNAWLHSPGMPPVIPDYDKTLSKECTQLAEKWSKVSDDELTGFSSDDISSFSSWQKIDFLSQLLFKDPLSCTKISAMDKVYNFSAMNNSEIKFKWLRLGLNAKSESAVEPAIKMVQEQGRMKYTRPLYRALGNWEKSRSIAIECFKNARCTMHSTTAQLVEKDLKL